MSGSLRKSNPVRLTRTVNGLQWTNTVTGQDEFIVKWGTSLGDHPNTYSVSASTFEVIFSDFLTVGGYYYFVVVAANDGAEGTESNEVAASIQ